MRKLGYSILGILLIGLIWYLFLKPYDYTIRFKTQTFPGAINQTLKKWDKNLTPIKKIEQNSSIYDLTQHLKFNDSTYRYQWHIQALSDSTSRVQVNVSDVDNSFMNKISVPFSDTDFEKRSRKTVKAFIKVLDKHINEFKVKVIGKESLPSTYCAYVQIETKQTEKALGMIKNFSYLLGFLKENQIEQAGIPFVEITQWNQETDRVVYNFCFPIVYHDSLPTHKEIKYKKTKAINALKAVYNGNYITSDRSWYKLLDYAKKENIAVVPKPLEYFYNNPSQGGNELQWKAEVYVPLRNNTNE